MDVPGVIEVEEYDEGGEGVGYYDITPGNKRGVGGTGGFAWNLADCISHVIRLRTVNHLLGVVYLSRNPQLCRSRSPDQCSR